MQKVSILITTLAFTLLAGCRGPAGEADAYGNFEAREVIVSAETPGRILRLDVEEGQPLRAGQLVGLIDTTALHLRREQLLAGIGAVRQKVQTAQPQTDVLLEQRQNLLREKSRLEALLRDSAATPKQLDDLSGQIKVVDEQISAAEAQTRTVNRGILAEIAPLEAQIRQIDDQIRRCYLHNPIDGVVLLRIAEPTEMTNAGQPLYKIANLDALTLRVYVTGAQLPHLRLGQEVDVFIDETATENRRYSGVITWVSDQAEFTPKIVQTKEERVNLVYAVKINVPNDGRLKIGMPAEVTFAAASPEVDSAGTTGMNQ